MRFAEIRPTVPGMPERVTVWLFRTTQFFAAGVVHGRAWFYVVHKWKGSEDNYTAIIAGPLQGATSCTVSFIYHKYASGRPVTVQVEGTSMRDGPRPAAQSQTKGDFAFTQYTWMLDQPPPTVANLALYRVR